MTVLAPRPRKSALRRLIRYRLVIPVIRSTHPPEYTARGVAIGVLWALTPLLGLQTLLMVVSWQFMKRVLRKDASLVQALLWSWVNNPATIVPLYYAFYVTGLWLLGSSAAGGGYAAFAGVWQEAAREPTMTAQATFVAREFGSALLVGCIPYAVAASALTYHWALVLARKRRHRIKSVQDL